MTKGVYKRTPEHGAAISKGKTGIPNTPEHNSALSKAKLGVPNSPEHNDAISKGRKNSDAVKADADSRRGIPRTPEVCSAIKNSEAVKANADEMRGGYDIVDHHMIYDHADLSRNIMEMTRSMHMKLHQLFRKHGIVIPHINVKEI